MSLGSFGGWDFASRDPASQMASAGIGSAPIACAIALAPDGHQVLDLVRRDDVEPVGVHRERVLPPKAERVEQLAARPLDEEQVPHVVQDVQRVEIVEVHALDRSVAHGRGRDGGA